MLKLPLLMPTLKAEDFAMSVGNFIPEFSVTGMFWSAALQQSYLWPNLLILFAAVSTPQGLNDSYLKPFLACSYL
jgi:hypothetical protein